MTKKLMIIVEGKTEQYFVKDILIPNLKNLFVTTINLKGGNISVESICDNVKRIKAYDCITTMVDYYGFKQYRDKSIVELETKMSQTISDNSFIPYIQQYEFEALLFSDIRVVQEVLGKNADLIKIRENPEDINHDNYPSKRLQEMFPEYAKTIDGINILKQIEWNVIRDKCPRFSKWVEKLENL